MSKKEIDEARAWLANRAQIIPCHVFAALDTALDFAEEKVTSAKPERVEYTF
jgi:hypothetical protein